MGTDNIPKLLHTIAAYVPVGIIQATINNSAPASPVAPVEERFLAAVLFADISGFTPLTESLGQKGSEGPEELTRLLNRYFSWMISFIEAEGGDVIKFGGDALTVIFPAKHESVGMAARRAKQAADTMILAMKEFGIMKSSVGLIALKMKIAIGTGEILLAHIGGVDDRWEYVIVGDPLRQTALAEKQAEQGQIVLSPEAKEVIALQALPLEPLSRPNWDTLRNPDVVAKVLRCYTPKPVRIWTDQGLHNWLATLRPMSVLFVGVYGLDYNHPKAITTLHEFLRGAQKIIYHYRGSLPRLTVDDKGTVLLILFGAPPYSHEDDAERALRCALDLQEFAQTHNLQLAIGVTTGRVFAGPVGSLTRREYTVMGDTVNLAARLMGVAGPGNIRCNYQAYRSAYNQINFDSLPSVELKGKSGLTPIYRPKRDTHLKWQPQHEQAEMSMPLIGRLDELTWLVSKLDDLKQGHGKTILVKGEAGIGKSKLVEAFMQSVQQQEITTILGKGRSIEGEIPYRVWQDIFFTYFNLANKDNVELTERQQIVQTQVTNNAPELAIFTPLLNHILHLDFAGNETTKTLDGTSRLEYLHKLLLTLLDAWLVKNPLVLIIEDGQWVDSFSWELIIELAQMNHHLPLLLVVVTRPLEGTTISILSALANTEHLRLDLMSPEDTVTLAVSGLGLNSNELPEAVANLVRVRASGNPFFAEEMFYYLYDNGCITFKSIEDKTRCLVNGDLSKAAQTLPATIQNVILSRIDQLPPDKQLTLRVAAVIGQIFTFNILKETLDKHIEITEDQLKEYLDDLIHLEFIRHHSKQEYAFKHLIIRDVAYQSLLFDRRRRLHRTVAKWYETNIDYSNALVKQSNDTIYDPLIILSPSCQKASLLDTYYSLLVYHWHQAEDDKKEQYYATLLGKQSVAQFANAEAVGYINRAFDLTDTSQLEDRYNLLLAREMVFDRHGRRGGQNKDLIALANLVEEMDGKETIVVALRQANYAQAIGDYPLALAAAQKAVTIAKQREDPFGECKGYIRWGRALALQANYGEAKNILEQALTLAISHNNAYDQANSLANLVYIDVYLGNYVSALNNGQQALDIAQDRGYWFIEACSLNMLGLAHYNFGNYLAAQDHFEYAVSIYYSIEDKRGELKSFYYIGLTHLHMNDYEIARDYFEQSVDIAKQINDQKSLADSLSSLGLTYCKLGDFAMARSYLGQALGIYTEINNPNGEAEALCNFGIVYYNLASNTTTKRYCELALAIQQKIGHSQGEIVSQTYLGHTLTDLEQLNDAIIAYNKALELHKESDHQVLAVDVLAGLAYVYMVQDNLNQAIGFVEEVLNWVRANGLNGVYEPFLSYLKCYQVLNAAAQDNPAVAKRAQTVLNTAHELLHNQASEINNEFLQKNFLKNIIFHQHIITLWQDDNTPLYDDDEQQPSSNSSRQFYTL